MSYLERLSIQGIRSFSPEGPQTIRFDAPVTLILGPNGTGKTTIIECLKYATTGELPPGSKAQASFIHDPKLVGQVEVKAKVGLQLLDMSGDRLVVSRCMAATQKPTNRQVSMRSLDSSIKCILPDGTTQSLSSRCADIDNEIVNRLGVSKAVLENVIFVHQEESNWPLQEAKQVKQKFDDLFASARYVKALEMIRRSKQAQDQNVKLHKVELKHLTKQKDEGYQLKSELEIARTQLSAQDDSLKKIESRLKPLEEEQCRYMEQYTELCRLNATLESQLKEKTNLESTISSLEANIRAPFEGTTEELQRACEDSEISLSELERNTKRLEDQLQSSKIEHQKLLSSRSDFMQRKGRLELEEKQAKTSKSKAHSLMEQYALEFSLAKTDSLESFSRNMQDLFLSEELNLNRLKKDFESQEGSLRDELDVKKVDYTCLQHEIDTKNSTKAKHQRDLERIRANLDEVSHISRQLDDLRRRLTEVEESLALKSSLSNVEQLRDDINEAMQSRKSLESNLSNLEKEIKTLHKESSLRNEIEFLEKEKQAKEDNIRKLRNRHSDVFEHFFGQDVPKNNLKRVFDSRIKILEEDNHLKRKQLQENQRMCSRTETTIQHLKATLQAKKEKIKEYEDELYKVCRSSNLQDSLEKVQQRKKIVEDERATAQGNLTTFKKFIERLEKDHPACPLCHRDFHAQSDATDLIEELKGKISRVPDEVARKDRELVELNKQYDVMIRLQPLAKELVKLKEEEVPQLNSQLERHVKDLENTQNAIESMTCILENNESDEKMGKASQTDIALIDRYEMEINDLSRKLSLLYDQLTNSGSGNINRSLATVQEEKEKLQQELQDIQRSIEMKRQSIDEQTQSLQSLRSEQNRLKEQILKIEAGMQEKAQMNAEMTRLNNELQHLATEMEEARRRLYPMKTEIEKLDAEMQKLIQEKENALNQQRKKISKISDKRKDLDAYIKDIAAREASGLNVRLATLMEDFERNATRISQCEKEISSLELRIKQGHSDVANHKIRQRELEDILKVRKLERQLIELSNRLKELQEKVQGVQFHNIQHNQSRINRDIDELRKQKQLCSEKKLQLITQVQYMTRDLKDKYVNAERDYQNALYDVVVREVVSSDLEKYYWALDKAIMMFHRQKIAEVNRIVKELWRATYKGTDIDYIEICTEAEEPDSKTGATLTQLKSRRSYNYRVVMQRCCGPQGGSGTAGLDMRGRCSAGQRVLASLIIRLALAEVFCLQCGLLALDEPTTNLDRSNIESLAAALSKIIQTRSEQRNFQLVVITHDEDFVELLGRSDFVDDFYSIERNYSGHSIINKRSIAQSFHGR